MPNSRLTNVNLIGPIPLTIFRSGRCSCIQLTDVHWHHVRPFEIECSPLPCFRSRPAIACALLPGAIVRKTVPLYLQLAYRARLLTIWHWPSFLLASLGDARRVSFCLPRGCAFSQLLIPTTFGHTSKAPKFGQRRSSAETISSGDGDISANSGVSDSSNCTRPA